MLIDLASEQSFPVGELVGIAIAFILLTILFRSFAAMAVTLVGALIGVMAGQILLTALASAARPALVRQRDRDDARPRRRHRLLAADHLALPRTGRGG